MTHAQSDTRCREAADGEVASRSKRWRITLIGLIAVELVVLSTAHTFFDFIFVCRDVAPAILCEALSGSVGRAIVFLGASSIILLSRPDVACLLFRQEEVTAENRHWVWVQLAGFSLILLPWLFLSGSTAGSALWLAFAFWIAGGTLASVGAIFAFASPRVWRDVVKRLGPLPLALLAASMLTPEISDWARRVWSIDALTRATFDLVVGTLDLFGVEATAHPESYTLTAGKFFINISSQCSGVEGLALISLFLLCYFYVLRSELRFPQVWILLPIGLVLSWLLNVVRIAGLFAIGLYISPTLAVNGFHSHAGWLMFCLLSLSLIVASRAVPWFQRGGELKIAQVPLLKDWAAARILPFAAFMAASLLVSTFTQVPEVWYLVKVLLMTAGLSMFLPLYAQLNWRLDPLSICLGAAVGGLWIWISLQQGSADASLDAALSGLPVALFVFWVVTRVAGTVVLVPLVEELFFRGYVLEGLDRGGLVPRIVALSVSTGLFAALHGRWMLAAMAGLVYGLLYLRQRNLVDAVTAHATSNLVIAIYAIATSQWSII